MPQYFGIMHICRLCNSHSPAMSNDQSMRKNAADAPQRHQRLIPLPYLVDEFPHRCTMSLPDI